MLEKSWGLPARVLLIAGLALLLAACGQKGPLKQPNSQQQPSSQQQPNSGKSPAETPVIPTEAPSSQLKE